jgi:transposase
VLSDGLGNPLRFKLSAGQRHDLTQAEALMSGQSAQRVIADRSYDANWFIKLLEVQGIEVVIPPRRNRRVQREYDQHWYKERHLVECLIAKLKWYRRVFSRFDQLARNYLSFLCFAAALIWLR